jgi:hypothetical protein
MTEPGSRAVLCDASSRVPAAQDCRERVASSEPHRAWCGSHLGDDRPTAEYRGWGFPNVEDCLRLFAAASPSMFGGCARDARAYGPGAQHSAPPDSPGKDGAEGDPDESECASVGGWAVDVEAAADDKKDGARCSATAAEPGKCAFGVDAKGAAEPAASPACGGPPPPPPGAVPGPRAAPGRSLLSSGGASRRGSEPLRKRPRRVTPGAARGRLTETLAPLGPPQRPPTARVGSPTPRIGSADSTRSPPLEIANDPRRLDPTLATPTAPSRPPRKPKPRRPGQRRRLTKRKYERSRSRPRARPAPSTGPAHTAP